MNERSTLPRCACGCDTRIPATDNRGRPKRYINGHNRRVVKLKVKCSYCDIPIELRPSRKNNNGRYFCSRPCQSKFTGDMLRGTTRPDWVKRKISSGGLGKKLSGECKRKLSAVRMGMKFSDEHKHNLSIAHRGDKSSNWRGGTTDLPYPWEWDKTLRESIRQRDGYCCRICGKSHEENARAMSIHHIDYDRDNLDPKNLVSLCNVCHSKTNYKRKSWQQYFQVMLRGKQVG